MEEKKKTRIAIQVVVDAPKEKVWKLWNNPNDIMGWYKASDDWDTPKASNNLEVNGKFSYRMESVDGKFGFDFSGTYTSIKAGKHIDYTIDDGRRVSIQFIEVDGKTEIVEAFEAEDIHSATMQRDGWQAILNNFKKYVESH